VADKLLVRAYNVEVGDCVYCRIPKAKKVGTQVKDFHMLIDCGSVGGGAHLKAAVENLETVLPDVGGGKRGLDLLVVTHEHKDHIAGFDPEDFKNIKIDRIWMNTAMDPTHPQAGRQTFALKQLATTAMRNLAALHLALSPELESLVALYAVDNDAAMEALRNILPNRNDITPTYVHAGMPAVDLALPLQGASITVLGPEKDIDRFYLGGDADDTLFGLAATGAAFSTTPAGPPPVLTNISQTDFRKLQSRMMSSALAFSDISNKVTNNTSVVLLIEWKGKRLLFVGDAEWDQKFKDGKANGAWNVMWHERKDLLNAPIDFLKIGHHGSENATPWNDLEDGQTTEPSTILDAILPRPATGAVPTAKAVVSTKRKNYATIPRSALLAEIGTRVSNIRNYEEELGARAPDLPKFTEYEKRWIGEDQPWRTDCELELTGIPYVDVEIDP
jgi:hypothetical protein